MNITFSKDAGNLTVNIKGRLDTTTSPELNSFLDANYNSISALTIDCKELAYISSAGLRVLLTAQKTMKDNMKLINVSELVMEVFEMTGFTDILTIE